MRIRTGDSREWPRFTDRVDAGRRLGAALAGVLNTGPDLGPDGRPVIAALPRGGVPVGYEVARALGGPLDVIVVRKLSTPWQPELALGAVGEGVRVVDEALVRRAGVGADEWAAIERAAMEHVARRSRELRAERPPVPLAGRAVVIVDDGIATGFTARAACLVVRALGARRIVLATPVAPPETAERLREDADEVVCLSRPSPFGSVGRFYADFEPTSDDEVVRLLRQSR